MKLAQLAGNIGKHGKYALATIANDGLNPYSSSDDFFYSVKVKGIGFIFYVLFVKNLTAKTVHKNHHTKLSTEICGVHQNIDRRWKFFGNRNGSLIDVTLNCPCRAAVLGG